MAVPASLRGLSATTGKPAWPTIDSSVHSGSLLAGSSSQFSTSGIGFGVPVSGKVEANGATGEGFGAVAGAGSSGGIGGTGTGSAGREGVEFGAMKRPQTCIELGSASLAHAFGNGGKGLAADVVEWTDLD